VAIDESMVRDMEKRLRDVEDALKKLRSLEPRILGSVEEPIEALYLKEKQSRGAARLTYNKTTNSVRVEGVG